jgi:hypothetical protein
MKDQRSTEPFRLRARPLASQVPFQPRRDTLDLLALSGVAGHDKPTFRARSPGESLASRARSFRSAGL